MLVLWRIIDGPITITRGDPLGDLLASTKSLLLNVPFDIAVAGDASARPYFKPGRWRVELRLGNWLGMNSSYIAVVNISIAGEVQTTIAFPFKPWPVDDDLYLEGTTSVESIIKCGADA